MFLSIVIPTFNRCNELLHSLNILKNQVPNIDSKFPIEIIVCDDASSDGTEEAVKTLEEKYHFIKYIRYENNIGLEKNLIESTKNAIGEYLWIFGDDDFLETENTLEKITSVLSENNLDLLILNRTRRSFSLNKLITNDWMGIAGQENQTFNSLKDFYIQWGFISVIGFITVNVMKREQFINSFDEGFFGTMYPQLGMMSHAFSSANILLYSEPLICHRTQTAEEKAQSFKNKNKEKVFMSDVDKRNAIYFGAPYIRMINKLVEKNSLSYSDINQINENTVINGRLVDFLYQNIIKAVNFGIEISPSDQIHLNTFFSNVDLDDSQVKQLSRYAFMTDKKFDLPIQNNNPLTISVITPSYNQVQFFHECLDSVFNQTNHPIEHIVLDPGSNDGSLNVARYYKHVTLINEPDEGQGDAVAKGILMAKGDLIAWINSDDSYYDNTVFETITNIFKDDDDLVYGNGIFMAGDGSHLRDCYINKDPSTLTWRFQQEDGILQPALFFRKNIIHKIGLPSKYLEYCMDYEYWIRAMKEGLNFRHVDQIFAKAYFHVDNKTYGQRGESYKQVCDMLFEQFEYVNHVWLMRYAEYLVEGFDGVVDHSSNNEIKDKTALNQEYIKLLTRFNTSAGTIEKLNKNCSQKGYGDTLRELKNYNLIPTHYKEIEPKSVQAPGFVNYEMGGKLWCFEKPWKDAQINHTHQFFQKVIEKRKNDTCIIICNGPSLNNTDSSLFANADVIASNNIFLSNDIIKHVDYYTCVNYLVAEQSAPQINNLSVNKVLPWWLAYCINPSENTFFVDAKGFPEFSTDIFKNISWRHTVTFYNMHLAYGLGYKKAILVGCDHNYIQPKGVEEQEVILSSEDDNNHFDPRYFKSKKWQAADVDQMEAMYALAKDAFEKDNRELINCTEGGKLELFRRSSLDKELSSETHKKITKLLNPTIIGPFCKDDKRHFDETNLISEYLSDNDQGQMIDVGCHHGYAAAPFLNKNWNVLAFEPDPNNRKILTDRLGDNPKLTILDQAVSDTPNQTVSFYASDESTGISSLSNFTDNHKKLCEVTTTTLRDQLTKYKIQKIDFLKIDTEGFDLMVLKGFPWDNIKPKIIECEFENSKTESLGYKFEDIADFLLYKGYHVYVSEWNPIVRYGVQHSWKSLSYYPCELSDKDAWGNLLAFDELPDENLLFSKLHNLIKPKEEPKPSKPISSPSKQEISQHIEDEVTHTALFNFLKQIKLDVSRALSPHPKAHALGKKVFHKLKKSFKDFN